MTMLKIPGVYVDFKGDLTELKRDFKKVRALSKQAGTDISNGMKNAILPNTVTKSFNKLYQDLTKINRVAGVTAADLRKLGITIDKDLLKNIRMTNSEFQQLQRRMLNTKAEQQAERAIKSIGRAAKLTAIEMALLRHRVGDTRGALRGLRVSAVATLVALSGLAAGVTAVGFAFVGAGYAVKRSSDAIWETGRATKVAENAYKEITGSVAAANREFAFLREISDELGLNFYTLREGFVGFLAAAKDSKIPMQEARAIFRSVSNAAAILGLSNERVKYTFMALEQMMSKGKVSMEELRRQMGDNLYGAFQKAAKAMGLSTEELDKLISAGELFSDEFLPKFRKQLDKDFKGTIDESVRASNKLSEAWLDLKNEMANSGFMDSATKSLKSFTETFKDPETISTMKAFAETLGNILILTAKLSKYLPTISFEDSIGEQMDALNEWYDAKLKKGDLAREQLDFQYERRKDKIFGKPKWEFAEDTWEIPDLPPKKKIEPSKAELKETEKQLEVLRKSIEKNKDIWGEAFDIDYGFDEVEAGVQKILEVRNNENLKLRQGIELQKAMAKAVKDTYLDYGKPRDALYDLDKTRNAIEEYSESFGTMTEGIESVVVGGFKTMEDSLVEFATTGKFEFKGMIRSMMADMARFMIQQALMKPLTESVSGFDFSSFFSGMFGSAASSVSYSDGGTVGAGGVRKPFPVIAHEGEVIGTPEQMSSLFGGKGGGIYVENNISIEHAGEGSEESDMELARKIGEQLKQTMREVIRDEKRAGGSLNGSMQRSYA